MEQWQFHQRARAIVNRFLPRVPADQVEGYESMLIGGELSMAVEDLMATLTVRQIPVTPAELADLRALLTYLEQPLDQLDRLTVAG